MCVYMSGALAVAGLALIPLFFVGEIHATAFDVTIGSTLLSGGTAVLAFDFIDGGPPDNAVNVSNLMPNGAQNSTSTTGNVTGAAPWTFSDVGNSFFNELGDFAPSFIAKGVSNESRST